MRARIRLGLMIVLASLLLLVLVLQGSMQWLHLDARSLLTSSAVVVGILAVAYLVVVLGVVAFVRYRRKAMSGTPCETVAPIA